MADVREGGESGAGRGRTPHPELVLRTMRGGLVDPSDLPGPDSGLDIGVDADIAEDLRTLMELGVYTRADVDQAGNPRVVVWMPQSVTESLAELTEDGARMRFLDGDLDGARRGVQFADDLRALMALGGRLDLDLPGPGTEYHN